MVNSARAADHVIAAIEARIAAGGIDHGDRLPSERALMEEFGASRTVIREAITALANRGLLDCRPRHRPVVRQPGFETVLDATGPAIRQLLGAEGGVENLYRARVFIERALVREAAQRADRSAIAALKHALAANAAAVGEAEAFYRTDVAFHRVLYEVPGNPVFPAVHAGFVSWLTPRWDRMAHSADTDARNLAAHRAIFEAILERDADAAEAALGEHLETAWELVRLSFEQGG